MAVEDGAAPRVPRQEGATPRGLRFLRGTARFVDGIVVPRMLWAGSSAQQTAHHDRQHRHRRHAGRRRNPDVVTGADLAERVQPIRYDSTMPTWPGSAEPALGQGKVRFVGEAVAAVVAEEPLRRRGRQRAGPRRVRPAPDDRLDRPGRGRGCSAVARRLGGQLLRQAPLQGRRPRRGVRRGRRGARPDVVSHRHSGIPMECRGSIAECDDADETLTLWTSTQIPHLCAPGSPTARLARKPHPRDRARRRRRLRDQGHLFPEEVALCVLAMKVGRPLKWIEDPARAHARLHPRARARAPRSRWPTATTA